MANYKVGDLDVTISGVSKDAVSSLDEVIKQLDTLQGKLGTVSRGFGGAFKNINTTAVRATTRNFSELQQGVESAGEALRETAVQLSMFDASFNDPTQMSMFEEYPELFAGISDSVEEASDSVERFNCSIQNGSPESADRIKKIDDSAEHLVKTLSGFDEARAKVSKLSSELLNMHFETDSFDESKVSEMLTLTKQIDETNQAVKHLGMSEEELTIEQYNVAKAAKRQQIAFLEAKIAMTKNKEEIKVYTEQLKKAREELKELESVSQKASSNKGGFGKLIKQIGRIALYRTIRRGLQLITQTFRESIQAYAQVDGNINDMMTHLTSSTKVISLSLGTIIFPILQALTPVVQSLSVGFANMANAINKSMALAQRKATYTKINTDALKDYAKQLNKTSGALFDFDKFRALSSKKDDNSIFLSTESVDALDEAESKYSGIYTLVSGIGDVLSQALKLVGQILDAASPIINVVSEIAGWLLEGVGSVLEFLNNTGLIETALYGVLTVLGLIGAKKVIEWIDQATLKTASLGNNLLSVLSTTQAMAVSILALVGSISYFTHSLDEIGDMAKWLVPFVAAVTAAIIGVFTAIVAVKSAHLGLGAAIKAGISAAALSGAVALAVSTAIAKATPQYAMGASDIDGGSLFVAGEAGKTEMVYTGDNGKTNVANVQQMYQAEYAAVLQALKDYGAARGEIPQLIPASDTSIYQAASRGSKKSGKTFMNV